MKTVLRLLLLAMMGLPGPLLRADDSAQLAAVRAADDERVAAMIAADPVRLDALLSAELHYAHSNGVTDTKASLTEALTSHRMVYQSMHYARRDFIPAGPGVVLMTGRLLLAAASQGNPVALDLNFLGVWREEAGHWRFLAWQSSKNPPPAKP